MRRLAATLLPLSLLAFVPGSPAGTAAEKDGGIPAGYKLLYQQSFDAPESLKDFTFTDPAEWKHGTDGKNGWLELAYDKKAKPKYQPKHRSPLHFALVANKSFGDFVLEADMQSTVAPYGHQDLCLFFGFTAPEKYYYVHMAVAADPNAHNVFRVADAPRKNIAKETTKGITWKAGEWHKVRLVREASAGAVAVYFDDMTKPIMRADDATFRDGHLGVGSFDDTGRYDNLKVWGKSAEDKPAPLTPAGK